LLQKKSKGQGYDSLPAKGMNPHYEIFAIVFSMFLILFIVKNISSINKTMKKFKACPRKKNERGERKMKGKIMCPV